ncbi:alpha/beta hydrolase-fold protein [Gallaecimonas sp. GXIMD4217]|uniref:alpha/beta hydrolase n=1 Tax=Gallaecimonas sp. GXIMD4217 TaxID=3131927 RepID=UPI00311AD4C4
MTSSAPLLAKGVLSDNQRIDSKALGYALQYRVYTPSSHTTGPLPTLYVTDGHQYLQRGKMVRVLDREIAAGRIVPVLVVFVDSRDPDKLSVDRRNQQFFCSPDYAAFFTDELIPAITRDYGVSRARRDRVVLGLSFGALNSACFGLLAPEHFGGLAMQSPALHPVPGLLEAYRLLKVPRLKIFLSLGIKNDNTASGRRLRKVLMAAGHELTYREVAEGHNWDNWRPLLDEVLATFFASEQEPAPVPGAPAHGK